MRGCLTGGAATVLVVLLIACLFVRECSSESHRSTPVPSSAPAAVAAAVAVTRVGMGSPFRLGRFVLQIDGARIVRHVGTAQAGTWARGEMAFAVIAYRVRNAGATPYEWPVVAPIELAGRYGAAEAWPQANEERLARDIPLMNVLNPGEELQTVTVFTAPFGTATGIAVVRNPEHPNIVVEVELQFSSR